MFDISALYRLPTLSFETEVCKSRFGKCFVNFELLSEDCKQYSAVSLKICK